MNIYKTAVDKAREALAQAEVLIDDAIEGLDEFVEQHEPLEPVYTAEPVLPPAEPTADVLEPSPAEPAVHEQADEVPPAVPAIPTEAPAFAPPSSDTPPSA